MGFGHPISGADAGSDCLDANGLGSFSRRCGGKYSPRTITFPLTSANADRDDRDLYVEERKYNAMPDPRSGLARISRRRSRSSLFRAPATPTGPHAIDPVVADIRESSTARTASPRNTP